MDHYLHIYDRIFEAGRGNTFQKRYPVAAWKHRITAMGGCDTASCEITVNINDAEHIFAQYLGSRVALYVQNSSIAWEGFINRIVLGAGEVEISRGFDSMMNRVVVTYYNNATQATEQSTSTVGNPASRILYGRKDGNIDAGVLFGGDASSKTALRDRLLADRAFPETSTRYDSDGTLLITLELKGFYHLFDWTEYNSSNTNDVRPDVLMRRMAIRDDLVPLETSYNASFAIATANNSTLAFAEQHIQTNNSFFINRFEDTGIKHWQKMLQTTEAGDGVIRWVCGIGYFDPNQQARFFYYRPASDELRYRVQALGSAKVIRNAAGAIVPPWEIRPDGMIEINDLLLDYDQAGSDPRRTYIQSVEYDADRMAVTFQSGDDITVRGVLQAADFNRETRTLDKPFGEARRQISSAGGSNAANRTLSNLLSPTAVNQSLIPSVTDTHDLGGGTTRWNNLFMNNLVRIGSAGGALRDLSQGAGWDGLTLGVPGSNAVGLGGALYHQNVITSFTDASTAFSAISDDTGAVGSLTVGSAGIADGRSLLFTIMGATNLNGVSTGNVEIEFRQNTTTRFTAVMVLAAAQNRPFELRAYVRRTGGSTGVWQAATAATHMSVTNVVTAASTVVFNLNRTWDVRARFTATGSSRTITITHLMMQLI